MQPERVDLHHHSVDLVLDVVTVLPPPTDERLDLGDTAHHLVVMGDGQAEFGQPAVCRGLCLDVKTLVGTEPVDGHGQRTPGRDPGILLPQRAGGGVARIGERLLARRDQGGVELGERRRGEENLAPDLQQHRDTRPTQAGRHRREGADVRGDVLADPPVAAGGRPDQTAVLIDQVDRQPVDLQLAQPGLDVGVPGRPQCPGLKLGIGEDVVQREHPFQMLDRREQRREGAGDLLGRRVRGAQLRVPGLDLRQLTHELVVFSIGDGR